MSITDLSWSNEYVLGIDIIDEQHQKLFSYLEEINAAIKQGDARVVENVVRGMVDYAISHNNFEETLMERAGYPELAAHREAHDKFRERANVYVTRLENKADPFKLAEQVRVFLGLWLISHVKQDDRDYAPFVRKSLKANSSILSSISRFFKSS